MGRGGNFGESGSQGPNRKPIAQREGPSPIFVATCKALKSWGAVQRGWGHHLPPGLWKEPWASHWGTCSLGDPEEVIDLLQQSFPICEVGIITTPVLLA